MNTFFDNKQFPYLKNRSCEDALLFLTHYVNNHTNDKKVVRCLFADYSSAFNLVSHSRLLQKLQSYHVPSYLNTVIASFLSNRPQIVKVGKNVSTVSISNTGTPQGSVISPILYIIYTNDLLSSTKNCTFIKFADDTCLLSNIKDEKDLKMYELEIEHLCNWSDENKLLLNPLKTKELVFDFTKKGKPFGKLYNIKLDGQSIKQEAFVKYLGVFIDKKLSWKHHVNTVIKRTVAKMYYVKNFASYVRNNKYSRSIYEGLVRPLMEYCMSVCHFNLSCKQIQMLERQQKYSARTLGFVPVNSLNDRRTEICTRKFSNISKNPNSILYSFVPPRHRFCKKYRTLLAKTQRVKRSYFFTMPTLLNNCNYT